MTDEPESNLRARRARLDEHLQTVPVVVIEGVVAALPAVLRRAHALWNDAAGWHARVLDRTVADLLDLKNDTWLDEDEKTVTADEFTQRIALQSVGIDGNGAFEFCFADGDLFWGHAIMVRGTLEEGPTATNIAG